MEYSELRKWLKNLSRFIIVVLIVIISITFYYSLHKILGISAVLLGSILVLIIPALIHKKIVADSKMSKCFDWFIVIYGIVCIIGIGFMIIYNWNNK